MKRLNTWTYVCLTLVMCFVIYLSIGNAKAPETQKKFLKTAVLKPVQSSNSSLQDSIVAFGMSLLGTPYEVAGCSMDGFDCSGFVYYVYRNFDIEVPRSSAAFENFGKEIPIGEVQKGDLLLFLSPTRNAIGHIGIVSNPKGKQSEFIHASSGREMKVIVTPLSNPGYTKRFVKAVRVL